jgi:micrococcal nuclease
MGLKSGIRLHGCGVKVWALTLLLLSGLLASPLSAASLPSHGRVISVLDGDTVLLDSGEKVRYLGIDAPEVAYGRRGAGDCFAGKAKQKNSELVLGKNVKLVYDHPTRDRYDRLLAYVFLPDGKCINAEMVRLGFAYLYKTPEGFGRQSEFVSYQQEALQEKKGLWGECSTHLESLYVGNMRSFILHRPDCSSVKQMSNRSRVSFKTREQGFGKGYRPCRNCRP